MGLENTWDLQVSGEPLIHFKLGDSQFVLPQGKSLVSQGFRTDWKCQVINCKLC